MTWRDEPVTKGELYEAFTKASKRVRKGERGISSIERAYGFHSPVRYVYSALSSALHALASFGEEIAADIKGPPRYRYVEIWESISGGYFISDLSTNENLAVQQATSYPDHFVMADEMEDD